VLSTFVPFVVVTVAGEPRVKSSCPHLRPAASRGELESPREALAITDC